MFDAKKTPEKPLKVDVVHRSETLDANNNMYLGYRLDHERNLELIGVFNENSAKEMSSDAYVNAIKAKFAEESETMVMFGASFAKKTVDELMSFKIILIPLPKGTIFNDYKVSRIVDEEPTNETKESE